MSGYNASARKAPLAGLSAALRNNMGVTLASKQHIAMDTAPQLFVDEVIRFLLADG